jgi:hypothetical protein
VALTAKQRKFAWLVASGVSKTKAYARAYNSKGNKSTQGKNGHAISKLPVVAAAIVEFEARLLPFADLRAEKINMLQNLRNLALSPNVADKIRLAASIKLYEICAERERAEMARLPEGRSLDLDHLTAELLELMRAREEAKGSVFDGSCNQAS